MQETLNLLQKISALFGINRVFVNKMLNFCIIKK